MRVEARADGIGDRVARHGHGWRSYTNALSAASSSVAEEPRALWFALDAETSHLSWVVAEARFGAGVDVDITFAAAGMGTQERSTGPATRGVDDAQHRDGEDAMNGPAFFQTQAGRKPYEVDVPAAVGKRFAAGALVEGPAFATALETVATRLPEQPSPRCEVSPRSPGGRGRRPARRGRRVPAGRGRRAGGHRRSPRTSPPSP